MMADIKSAPEMLETERRSALADLLALGLLRLAARHALAAPEASPESRKSPKSDRNSLEAGAPTSVTVS